jgi:hypothetical protein
MGVSWSSPSEALFGAEVREVFLARPRFDPTALLVPARLKVGQDDVADVDPEVAVQIAGRGGQRIDRRDLRPETGDARRLGELALPSVRVRGKSGAEVLRAVSAGAHRVDDLAERTGELAARRQSVDGRAAVVADDDADFVRERKGGHAPGRAILSASQAAHEPTDRAERIHDRRTAARDSGRAGARVEPAGAAVTGRRRAGVCRRSARSRGGRAVGDPETRGGAPP